MGVLRQVGPADGGHQGVQVNGDGPLVLCVRICLVFLPFPPAAALQVRLAGLVHREDAVLGTGLDSHVADAQPVLHSQALHAGADELQALVEGAGDADESDQVQDHVLAGHRPPQTAGQLHADGGGHLEPRLAGGHAGGHIRGAHAGGEGPHRAVGAGVAVGADDAVSGGDDALLRQEGVLHAHLAHVEEVDDAVSAGELPALLGLLGALDVLVGDEVIQNDVHPGLVENIAKARLFKLVDGHRSGDVVAQDNIKVRLDQLSRLDVLLAAVGSQDFLCHSHSHGYCASVLCDEVQGSPPLFTGY